MSRFHIPLAISFTNFLLESSPNTLLPFNHTVGSFCHFPNCLLYIRICRWFFHSLPHLISIFAQVSDSSFGMAPDARLLCCSASFVRRFSWERAPGNGLGLDSWARPPIPLAFRVVELRSSRLEAHIVCLKERRTRLLGAIGGPVHNLNHLICSPTAPLLASLDQEGEVGLPLPQFCVHLTL